MNGRVLNLITALEYYLEQTKVNVRVEYSQQKPKYGD
jgi:hypothetical protein